MSHEPTPSSTRPEAAPGALHMDPERMRALGYRVIDLLVDRWTTLPDQPAWVGADRAAMEALLREDAPEEGRPAADVLERAVADVLERAGRVDHPRFFAFVPSSPTWPSVLAELLATGFNTFQGTWLESAGPSQIELVVLDWFRDWLGMPDTTGGLFTSGGSAANLYALAAAREWAGNRPDAVVYLSDQGHSSIARAARTVGLDPSRIRTVATADDFRMDLSALEEAIASDRALGLEPICVCANAGATNTGVVDPLLDLSDLCRREGLWFHVDGAYGGFAVLTERGRAACRGIERADSVTLDPHKWLFQPYETGCLLVRDTAALDAAFRVSPEYLQDADMGLEHVNFADRGIQLTRSFRALKVWMSIQTFGLASFRKAIDDAIDLATRAEDHIRRAAHLQLLSGAQLGVVCYRVRPAGRRLGSADLERLNVAVQDAVLKSGVAMMSSTRIRGEYSLRLCILGHRSTWSDVERTLGLVEELGLELSSA